MTIYKTKDYEAMARKAAGILSAQVVLHPRSVLGLATGATPVGVYSQLARWQQEGEVDFSGVVTVNLDEYCGLGPEHPQSYRYFMEENFFSKTGIKRENTHLPDGLAADPAAECARYDGVLRRAGRIDLQLLGLGHNGHIGFNEPGDRFVQDTHQVELADSTIQANTRFFEQEEDVPRRAFTMGIRPIMQARRILVVVSGQSKAEIVRRCFMGPVTPQVPGSVLQLHGDVTLVGDEAALSLM